MPAEIKEKRVDIKGKCTLPFAPRLQLKLEQHFMSGCCFLSPQGPSLIETLHTEPGTSCDVPFSPRIAAVKRLQLAHSLVFIKLSVGR